MFWNNKLLISLYREVEDMSFRNQILIIFVADIIVIRKLVCTLWGNKSRAGNWSDGEGGGGRDREIERERGYGNIHEVMLKQCKACTYKNIVWTVAYWPSKLSVPVAPYEDEVQIITYVFITSVWINVTLNC